MNASELSAAIHLVREPHLYYIHYHLNLHLRHGGTSFNNLRELEVAGLYLDEEKVDEVVGALHNLISCTKSLDSLTLGYIDEKESSAIHDAEGGRHSPNAILKNISNSSLRWLISFSFKFD